MDGNLSVGELMIETLNNWFLIHKHRFTTLTCYFKEKRRHQPLSPLLKAFQTVFGSNDRWTGARPQRSIQVIFIDRPCCPSKTARSETIYQKNKNNRLDRAANFKSHRIGRTNTTLFLSWQWTHKMADKRWTHCCTFGCVQRKNERARSDSEGSSDEESVYIEKFGSE